MAANLAACANRKSEFVKIKTVLYLIRLKFMGYFRDGDQTARFIGVKVGEDCRIYTRNFGSEPWLISIGSRVTVTSGVQFLTHDGSTWLMRDERGRRYRYAKVEVGNDVFIGINSIIMPGVRIGNKVIVGAGSVVTKSVPDGLIVAGNPARIIGRFADYEKKALTTFAHELSLVGENTRDRIDSVVEREFRPPVT
jgi:acetyltransferase-like isoleucine patch superfamily enzyme